MTLVRDNFNAILYNIFQVWYAYTQYYFSLLTEVSVNMSVVFVSFSQNENAKREHEKEEKQAWQKTVNQRDNLH